MPDKNPARRFKLACDIEAIANGAQHVREGLGQADDATVLEALTLLESKVRETRQLAQIIADLAPAEREYNAQQEAGNDV